MLEMRSDSTGQL